MTVEIRRATLEFLVGAASKVAAKVVHREDMSCYVSLPVERTGGAITTYFLQVTVGPKAPSVRELRTHHLPAFCPERHINPDGTFCFYWQPVDGITIDSLERATEWWVTLVAFLKSQARAARLGRWPNARGRAHGLAAQYQHEAELAARELNLESDLLRGDLKVVKGKRGSNGRALRLLRADKRILSVWVRPPKVVTVRRPCICGSHHPPRAMIGCGDHAANAATLVLSLYKMYEAEKTAMREFSGYECCGTMEECPLKKAA